MQRYFLPAPAPARHAFTLIELLVVVAIISILASIAVPNFMEAQVRAKVARVKNDMRVMSIGIETYRIDNNKCPVRRNTQAKKNPRYDPAETNPFSPNFGEYSTMPGVPELKNSSDPHVKVTQLARLTTPLAYLSSMLTDVFDTRNSYPDNMLDYWDDYQTMWFVNSHPLLATPDSSNAGLRINKPSEGSYMLVSVGPDGFMGVSNITQERNYGWIYSEKPIAGSMYVPYDPTNGAVSAGNIYNAPGLGGMDGTAQNLFKRFHPVVE